MIRQWILASVARKKRARESRCAKKARLSSPLPFSSSLGAHLMLPKTLSAFQYPFTNRKECYMTTVSFAYTSVRKRTSWICSNDLSDPFFWSICAYLSVFTFRLFFPFLLRISKAFTFFFSCRKRGKLDLRFSWKRRRKRTWAPRLLAYTVNNASPFQFQQQHRKRESIFTKLEAVMVINHFSFFFLKNRASKGKTWSRHF